MTDDVFTGPCPNCAERGHQMFVRDALSPLELVCPSLPAGARLVWTGMSFVRDNRAMFEKKEVTAAAEEFPEFSHAEDFFEAHDLIEI